MPEDVGGKPAGEKQVKSWQEREIFHACGSVCRIPQRSLRQITEIFPLLPIYPPSMPCPPLIHHPLILSALFSSAYSRGYFGSRFYVSYGLLV